MTIKTKLILYSFLIIIIPTIIIVFISGQILAKDIASNLSSNIQIAVLLIGLCLTVLTLLFVILFIKHLNTSLIELKVATQKVVDGNFDFELKNIQNDMFGNLALSINTMTQQLKTNSLKTNKYVEKIKLTMTDLKTVFNCTYNAYFILDIHGTIIDVNEKMLKMFGVVKDKALQLSLISGYSGLNNSFNDLQETWDKVVEGTPQSFEWNARRIDTGATFPVEVHLNKISFKKKDAILVTVQDISKRKKMEQTLIENKEKYGTIYYKSRDAFTILGTDGRFISANPSAVKLFGCRNEEEYTRGNPIDFSPEFQPDGTQSSIKVLAMIKTAIEKGSHFFYWKHMKLNGTVFHATVLLTRMQLNNSTVLQGTVRDITEQKKVEEQLSQAQKMETVGTLAGGLAHDFNNILAGILGTLSLIRIKLKKDGDMKTEKLKSYLDMMQKAGDKASGMIKHLLVLSRKQEIYFKPINLSLTIKHVIEICKSSFDKSIKLQPVFPDISPIVNADETQLEQVILNICINASHAMTLMKDSTEKWGGTLHLSIERVKTDKYFLKTYSEAKTGNYWHISVKDNGVGMSKETLERIFNPFFSTKDKSTGTGLGLSMVYNIIKQHSGFVSVYSSPGIGSTFNIYLPVSEQISETVKKEKANQPLNMREGIILVVDDEEILRNVVKEILEDCGYQVILAENGNVGVNIFRSKHKEITAVLLDMSMPEMSGEEAFIAMKKIDPNVKVLLSSGFKQDQRVTKTMSLGVDAFIQKPYTFDKLSETLDKIII